MTHYNGVFTEPLSGARDGYETTVGNGRTWIEQRSERARRTIRPDDLTLVCSECGNGHTACDCPASIRRAARLITLAAYRKKVDAS